MNYTCSQRRKSSDALVQQLSFRFFYSWLRRGNRIVAEFEHDSGGHFAAHEKPDELAGDLRKMFGKGGGAYGVVPGKDGYA